MVALSKHPCKVPRIANEEHGCAYAASLSLFLQLLRSHIYDRGLVSRTSGRLLQGKICLFGDKTTFTLNNINLLLLKLHNIGCSWSIVDVFEELLQSIICTLRFAFDLVLSVTEENTLRPTRVLH